jgi:hypothetical protein
VLVESGFEMVKKTKLIDDLPIIFTIIVVGYAAYRGITLYTSPNFFKELLGSWLIFLALSSLDLLVLYTIYYVSKKGAQSRGTIRSPKAETNIKRVDGFLIRMLAPFAIFLTALITIYFLAVFLTSAIMLTFSKSLTLYIMSLTTVLMYIMVMYNDIEVWRFKKSQQY